MRRNIFIFNPETDYALALGRANYTPPAKIVTLRKQLQLIQAHIAKHGDIIVVSNDFLPDSYPDKNLLNLIEEKEIVTIRLDRLAEYISDTIPSDYSIRPWGWNHSLRRQLLDAHIDEKLLKTNEDIDILRQLSHRRTTIPFQQQLQDSIPTLEVPLAKELFTIEEAIEYVEIYGKTFFKAPWSSSGRGILLYDPHNSALSLTEHKLREWIGGFINKQGSIMAERAFDRIADFATEWMIDDDQVLFLGLSLFNTSAEGRYLGNRHMSQEEINTALKALSPFWCNDVIEAQRQALHAVIASGYSGPVGIDMLIAADGTLNPCVEINLRHTMGMIALGIERPSPNCLQLH